jgi:arylamine N-acetyltransferase
MPAPLDPAARDRYLGALRVQRRPPGLDALAELVAAHVSRVPFENVSKLYRRRRTGLERVPDLGTFLDGIERFHFGGTCYANNFHLFTLLASLGYDARLCGADMREPDVHLVVRVAIGGREYLVDAGYGAPFLDPMPLDASVEQVVALGRDRYVLRPRDPAGRSRLEHHRDGVLTHGYLAKPEARRVEEFEDVVARSFLPGAAFMNAIVLARFSPGRATTIRNLSLVVSEGDRTETTPLRDREELVDQIERCFGIPAAVAAEAVAEVRASVDPWA